MLLCLFSFFICLQFSTSNKIFDLIPVLRSGDAKINSNVNLGRPLRDYKGLKPMSNWLKSNIKAVSEIGQPLAMKCTSEQNIIEKCTWTTPQGSSFDHGSIPEGITYLMDDDHTCQIEIESLSKDQLGKWSCTVQLKGQDQYQMAFMTATEVVPVTDVRLPTHAFPENYVIHLTPFIIPENFTIEGHVRINIKVIEDADNITLHIKEIDVYENMVTLTKLSDETDVKIEGHGYDLDRDFYIVKAKVKAAESYRLEITFLGDLNDDLAGLYRSTYLR